MEKNNFNKFLMESLSGLNTEFVLYNLILNRKKKKGRFFYCSEFENEILGKICDEYNVSVSQIQRLLFFLLFKSLNKVSEEDYDFFDELKRPDSIENTKRYNQLFFDGEITIDDLKMFRILKEKRICKLQDFYQTLGNSIRVEDVKKTMEKLIARGLVEQVGKRKFKIREGE